MSEVDIARNDKEEPFLIFIFWGVDKSGSWFYFSHGLLKISYFSSAVFCHLWRASFLSGLQEDVRGVLAARSPFHCAVTQHVPPVWGIGHCPTVRGCYSVSHSYVGGVEERKKNVDLFPQPRCSYSHYERDKHSHQCWPDTIVFSHKDRQQLAGVRLCWDASLEPSSKLQLKRCGAHKESKSRSWTSHAAASPPTCCT